MKQETFKNLKSVIIIFASAIIFISLVTVVGIKLYNSGKKAELMGTYDNFGNTNYYFDGKGNGYILDNDIKLEFKYKANGHQLFLDFSDDSETDIQYNYGLKDGVLNLFDEKGQAIILEKVDNK